MKSTNKFSALHRLLHWIMAIAMTVLFITGFLRMKWMSKTSIKTALGDQFASTPLQDEQVRGVIKSIQGPMWEWHEIFANVMILSFLVRIVYMLVKGIRFPNPFKSGISVKQRFQGMIYVYFYEFWRYLLLPVSVSRKNFLQLTKIRLRPCTNGDCTGCHCLFYSISVVLHSQNTQAIRALHQK